MTETNNFMAYVDAVQTGDIVKAIELRLLNTDDKTRYDTVDRIHSTLMLMYIAEIQALRLEVDGWKSICEGQDTLADPVSNPQKMSAARQQVKRGITKTERALRFRNEHHTEVDLPQTKRSP